MNNLQSLLQKAYNNPDAATLELLLKENDPAAVQEIFSFADKVRLQHVGDGIFLRGIVEFSSYCRNTCYYCGLNKNNNQLQRYRLTREEIVKSVAHIAKSAIRTVVLQSGEDEELDAEMLAAAIRDIKAQHDIAITLSVGEWEREKYALWRNAGADRYLLKIETTDPALYSSLHPQMSFENRLRCLDDLRSLGYQVGSGIIIGLRGQTEATIAGDILFFKGHDFDMIGIGPFIPHGQTELARENPGNPLLTLKTVALTRIVTRNSHLPATTALGSLSGKDYRIEGLKAGANVLMPNFTPQPYRKMYEIYPGKRCVDEPVGACNFCMDGMAQSIGRHIDYSRGDSFKKA